MTSGKQAATTVVAVLMLSGCLNLPGNGADPGKGGATPPPTERAPQSIRVASGQVAIVGPEGYCVDETGSRQSDGGGFVLLGSCRAISRNPDDPHPAHPLMLTASVARGDGAATPTGLDQLEEFFTSDAGRTALSRAQRADTVTINQVSRDAGVLYLQVTDTAPNALGAVSDIYWRGLFLVAGHVVTVTATGFAGGDADGQAGLSATKSLAAGIRAANPTRSGPLAALRDRLPRRNNSTRDLGHDTAATRHDFSPAH